MHHENEQRDDNAEENLTLLRRDMHGWLHHGHSEETIRSVRQAYAEGVRVLDIAERFAVSLGALYFYVEGLPRRVGAGAHRGRPRSEVLPAIGIVVRQRG